MSRRDRYRAANATPPVEPQSAAEPEHVEAEAPRAVEPAETLFGEPLLDMPLEAPDPRKATRQGHTLCRLAGNVIHGGRLREVGEEFEVADSDVLDLPHIFTPIG